MKLVRMKEYLYIMKNMKGTVGITWESRETGLQRIYVVPPKSRCNRTVPYLLIINGQKMIPIGISWAVMLNCLMKRLKAYEGKSLDPDNYEITVTEAINDTKRVYPAIHILEMEKEMKAMLVMLAQMDKAVTVNAFHPIRSEKQYVESLKKAGNEIWQYPDSTIVRSKSVKLDTIRYGKRKGGRI